MEEADVQYHSVSVADGHVTVSPVPQKSNKVRQCFRAARTPLFILVSLGLLGLTIEAYFINHVYHLMPAVTTQTPNVTTQTPNTTSDSGQDGPGLNSSCKPFAHLQLFWSRICGMEYKDGRLVVQKEGHYFVYSKVRVFFGDDSVFRHSVDLNDPGYGKPFTLMKSIKLQTADNCTGRDTMKKPCRQIDFDTSHSYLGGVFLLCRGCYFFVRSNEPDEGFFGAFMI